MSFPIEGTIYPTGADIYNYRKCNLPDLPFDMSDSHFDVEVRVRDCALTTFLDTIVETGFKGHIPIPRKGNAAMFVDGELMFNFYHTSEQKFSFQPGIIETVFGLALHPTLLNETFKIQVTAGVRIKLEKEEIIKSEDSDKLIAKYNLEFSIYHLKDYLFNVDIEEEEKKEYEETINSFILQKSYRKSINISRKCISHNQHC